MKIVLDTNVLVSATFWNGDSEKIIQKVENKEIELILSKEILDEFDAVLNYKDIQDKIKNKNLELKRTVEKITILCAIIEPKQKLNIIIDDPTDNKFLECAIEGKADFIVSKDKHLLKIKEYQGIKTITPEELLVNINKP
jgi:uncharacterized protein